MVALWVVDSGTTNTRVRRMEEGRVTQSMEAPAGAKDGPEIIRRALSQLFAKMDSRGVRAVVLSGMITSPTGLVEIPHAAGPVDLAQLDLVRHDFPDLSPLPFYFIPGVKLTGSKEEPTNRDIIRGEETELAGYLLHHGKKGRLLFIHLGSHHKAMLVEDGRLTQSCTALTGELLSAVANHTLLSVSLDLTVEPDTSYALPAARLCAREGLSRTLFMLRMMDIQDHASARARVGWALGALAQDDAAMISPLLQKKPDQVILYGREDFGEILASWLRERHPGLSPIQLTKEQSDDLAPQGAWLSAQRLEGD
jgi:2-dehydro-3-deoxygalactonokinase